MGKDKKSTVDRKLDRKLYDAVKMGKMAHVEKYLEEGANPKAPVGKGGRSCLDRLPACKNPEIEKLISQKIGSQTSRLLIGGERIMSLEVACGVDRYRYSFNHMIFSNFLSKI